MGKLHYKCSDLVDYNVELKQVEDRNVVCLMVCSEEVELNYKIHEDERNKSIEQIKKDLENALKKVKGDENSDISIREDLKRFYIHITFPDGITKQYSASKQ